MTGGPSTGPRPSTVQPSLSTATLPPQPRTSRRLQEKAEAAEAIAEAAKALADAKAHQYTGSYPDRWNHKSSKTHETLKTEAEKWLKEWLLDYNAFGKFRVITPYVYPKDASYDEVAKTMKRFRDKKRGIFHEALFVNALYDKCPHDNGRINMQIEILLTVSGKAENNMPSTLDEVVTAGNWRGFEPQRLSDAYGRLNMLAQILYIRMVIPCEYQSCLKTWITRPGAESSCR